MVWTPVRIYRNVQKNKPQQQGFDIQVAYKDQFQSNSVTLTFLGFLSSATVSIKSHTSNVETEVRINYLGDIL
jgi:hypothetical protein